MLPGCRVIVSCVIVVNTLLSVAAAETEKISSNQKQGGVCFRMDDNHKPYHWKAIAKVFNKHQKPFCASLNIGRMDDALFQVVLDLQKQGHEVLDHTPLHNLTRTSIAPGKTAEDYKKYPGVDHINGKMVCLRYMIPKRVKESRYVSAVANGKTITLPADTSAGKLKFLKANDVTVYIPSLKKVFRAFLNKNSKPPTLKLKSVWDEDNIDLGKNKKIKCYFMRCWVFRMAPEAYDLLAEDSLYRFKKIGAKRPYTMIVAGGGVTSSAAYEIKAAYGDKFGYKSSACWGGKALKVFNEPDPKGTRRFGMTWGDFNDEAKSLEWNKTVIADGVALHHVMMGRSHLSSKIGGWKGYLKRLDDLLQWCTDNNIPVHTYAQWSDILYTDKPDPSVNIFPALQNDIDKNGRPDGYSLKNAKVNTEGGVEASKGVCLYSSSSGDLFRVDKLGGLEKGANTLSFFLKGEPGTTVNIEIRYRESGKKYDIRKKREDIQVSVDDSNWKQYTSKINVPETAAICYISVSANLKGETPLFFSGPELRP